MPNGGGDNCGECQFGMCRIRDVAISKPFWHYCANHQHHNPLRIEVPVGPVYAARGSSYRRVVVHPSPDGDEQRDSLLGLLDQMIAGELDRNDRVFHLELMGHLGSLGEVRAVPGLVELACAPPGESSEIDTATRALGPDTFAARTEAVRRQARQALRAIADGGGMDVVTTGLAEYLASDDPATVEQAQQTEEFIAFDGPFPPR